MLTDFMPCTSDLIISEPQFPYHDIQMSVSYRKSQME